MIKIIIISIVIFASFGLLIFVVVDIIIDEIKISKERDKWCKLAMHDYPSMVNTAAQFEDYVDFARKLDSSIPEEKLFEKAYYIISEEWYDLNYK